MSDVKTKNKPKKAETDNFSQDDLDHESIDSSYDHDVEIKSISDNEENKKYETIVKTKENDKMSRGGGFMLDEFIKYIEACTILYIDYQITKNNISSESSAGDTRKNVKKIQKIIDLGNANDPKYINGQKIFLGEISF